MVEKTNEKKEERAAIGIVVKIIDEYRIVINKGALDGINEGQRYLIYEVDTEELVDPSTGENLGHLEIVKGTGRVEHVQERISTILSDKKEPVATRTVKRKPFGALFTLGGSEEETITSPAGLAPFDQPKIGDKAKPI